MDRHNVESWELVGLQVKQGSGGNSAIIFECLDCWNTSNSNPGMERLTHARSCKTRPQPLLRAVAPAPAEAAPKAPAEAAPAADGTIIARYPGRCDCGERVRVGDRIRYAHKRIMGCEGCAFGTRLSNAGGAAIVREGGAGKLDPAEVRELVAGGWVSASDAMNSDF